MQVGNQTVDEALAAAMEGSDASDEARAFARQIVEGVCNRQGEIDARIQSLAEGYTIDRLAAVDLAILRLAIYEILCEPDVPPAVAIDEAVDLAKKYSTNQSGAFINGILANLVKQEGLEFYGHEHLR